MKTKQLINQALRIIGTRGLSGVSAPAPTAAQALVKLGFSTFSDIERARILAEFRRQDLAIITQTDGSYTFQLSVKGVHRLQRAEVEELEITPPRGWDRQWRMVTYDIPTHMSKQRQLMARELERLGFCRIQDSTWLHPYPCFDVLSTLVAYCNLQRYVTIAEIARIDETTLRRILRHYPDLT